MARVPYLTPSTAPETVAGTLDKLAPLHVFGLMAHAETAFRPWLRFGGALLNDLALDPALRELAILRVGQLAARYEWDQHVPIALAVGVTQEQIDAVDRDELDRLDPLPRAVLEFVTGVVTDDVDDARYQAVASRLSEREVVELSLVAAHYLMLARMMTTLRIDPDAAAGPDKLLRG
ncbi:carboxymuconolactone decarboxylase family protein [Pseudonocardia spinosispora]|uniref:carboxymuconolactone decarboxylase family protein n=1 Tax=Pseudonocardia spinosispora TaxID=103441 RepID=UPI00040FD70C|nr:carboxymuconolactone decarboxylase family protein [Pseudonocardia spinosispora]